MISMPHRLQCRIGEMGADLLNKFNVIGLAAEIIAFLYIFG